MTQSTTKVSGSVVHTAVFSMAVWLLTIPLLLIAASVAAHESKSDRGGFDLPEPGSYSLQTIMPAPDGMVLDIDGSQLKLSEVTKGKITLLGFIYTQCPDGQGCPLTYHVFRTLQRRMVDLADLSSRVRLVSLSFDPVHDTPAIMKAYGGKQASRAPVEWRFLTAQSVRDLLPLLKGFGQDVTVRSDVDETVELSTYSHVLKVFLIDTEGMVREIYSSSFLLPDVLLNDIRTLLTEDEHAQSDKQAHLGCLLCDIHSHVGFSQFWD